MEDFIQFEIRLNIHIPIVEMIGTYYGKDTKNQLLKRSLKIIDYAETLNAILVPFKSQMDPDEGVQEHTSINFSLDFKNEENRNRFVEMLPYIR